MSNNHENSKEFYLGKIVDDHLQPDRSFLYPSKNFTTHAICLGMTGSGKTGLGISILEEAALDGIPSLIIDPKGDLSNLNLTFPNLSPEEFLPWIDESEAERNHQTKEQYAEQIAKQWRSGLQQSNESAETIKNLKEKVEIRIYTPGSKAGLPLSILSSLAAPKDLSPIDPDFINDEIQGIASSLLGLLGIEADPIKSRELIFLSNLIHFSWDKQEDLTLTQLIQQIQNPPFKQVGALDVNVFYPAKDRKNLAVKLNNLLASPGFQNWLEGDPLDIDQLLTNSEGKPKISILSIAHLSDAERMFFVTLLLNKLNEWMIKQSGTSNLRALFYMDEIFGYFPPTATPPSKRPMLKLLKQARAFGLGIILSTQNPADLDYKGLANCGTWFIGKLQTDRDRSRVVEGLSLASNGNLNSKSLEQLLNSLGNRLFLLRSIYLNEPLLFTTRWTLSYLRGPLTQKQIQILMAPFQKKWQSPSPLPSSTEKRSTATKPSFSNQFTEFFVNLPKANPHYKPFIGASVKLHFLDTKYNVDLWKDCYFVLPIDDQTQQIEWGKEEDLPEILNKLNTEPSASASYENLPDFFSKEKGYNEIEKNLQTHLYQNQKITLYSYPDLKLVSKMNESEKEFHSRVIASLKENTEAALGKINDKFNTKLSSIKEKIRKCEEKISQKQQESTQNKTSTFINMLTTILGALFGKKITKSTINQAGSSLKKVGKWSKDSQNIQSYEEELKSLNRELQSLENTRNQEINALPQFNHSQELKFAEIYIRPKKTDMLVLKISILWWPF